MHLSLKYNLNIYLYRTYFIIVSLQLPVIKGRLPQRKYRLAPQLHESHHPITNHHRVPSLIIFPLINFAHI